MIIVLDCETTGLIKHPSARVVELAAVALYNGREVGCFSSLVYATEAECIDGAAALAINGIDPSLLQIAPLPESVAEVFADWLSLYPVEYLTAFNVDFDRTLLERSIPIVNKAWGPCIMKQALAVMGPANVLPRLRDGGPWKYPSLKEAAAYFGVEVQGNTHRALTDARTAAGVLVRMAEQKAT